MQFKALTLATTSLMALGLATAPVASAKTEMMGEVELDVSYYWDDYGAEGSSYEDEYTVIIGTARVNVPYDEWYNLQFDVTGAASTYEDVDSSSAGHFGVGAHVNWRDPRVGLLGVFMAVGRANAFNYGNGPTYLAGFEGQYYCEQWTFAGQLGYWDSGFETSLLQNAGFLRGVVSYYASERLKLTGALKYIDGELPDGSDSDIDSDGWDWDLRVDYLFGKSMPVATFVEVGGRYSETYFGFGNDEELDVVWANIGVTFYLGGEGTSDLKYQDRNGASADLPDFDEVRVPGASK